MNTIVITIISLSVIGSLSGLILFMIAQKFKVEEDPRIEEVLAVLPEKVLWVTVRLLSEA